MNLDKVHKLYFLGIGGIGMSALARYFHQKGVEIHGYDLTPSPLTETLQNEGMMIHFEENIHKIPEDIDLAIYTPAIPSNNKELIFLKESKKPFLKRADLIEQISANYFTIAIAGTHGKTSISAITAHIFKSAGKNITALIGGICKNYHSNLIHSEPTDYFLVEADEYDRSFLKLHPDIALVSSMDADHLDIYKNHEELKKNFRAFANNINSGGILFYHKKLAEFDHFSLTRKSSYGIKPVADATARNIQVIDGKFRFDVVIGDISIQHVTMQIPGNHYVENALAAAAIAFEAGISTDKIKKGLESFLGVERRFEIHLNTPKIVCIDDYAHHPEEIRVTIEATRKLFPGRKITGIFQPHLFSRTRDFANGFAQVLDKLDEIILLEIYPARELPMEGVTSKIIFDLIKNQRKIILEKNKLLSHLQGAEIDVLLTLGAGDIGTMTQDISSILMKI